MGSPSHWPSVTCAAACVSDTARRLPAHCETMGVRSNHTLPALGHIGPEVSSFYSVSDKTCLLAGGGAEQEGPAHNPRSTHGPNPPSFAFGGGFCKGDFLQLEKTRNKWITVPEYGFSDTPCVQHRTFWMQQQTMQEWVRVWHTVCVGDSRRSWAAHPFAPRPRLRRKRKPRGGAAPSVRRARPRRRGSPRWCTTPGAGIRLW